MQTHKCRCLVLAYVFFIDGNNFTCPVCELQKKSDCKDLIWDFEGKFGLGIVKRGVNVFRLTPGSLFKTLHMENRARLF